MPARLPHRGDLGGERRPRRGRKKVLALRPLPGPLAEDQGRKAGPRILAEVPGSREYELIEV